MKIDLQLDGDRFRLVLTPDNGVAVYVRAHPEELQRILEDALLQLKAALAFRESEML